MLEIFMNYMMEDFLFIEEIKIPYSYEVNGKQHLILIE